MALAAVAVKNAKHNGKNIKLTDGGGLHLLVTKTAKLWRYSYRIEGKQRTLAIGQYPDLSLADARACHIEARKLVAAGVCPSEKRRLDKEAEQARKSRERVFSQVADECIAQRLPRWKNQQKMKRDWENSLKQYAGSIMNTPVSDVGVDQIINVLKPIWSTKPTTAAALRTRIELILSFAAVHGYRDRNQINPASWRGNLDHVFQPTRKILPVKHHASMPWRDAPQFVERLLGSEDTYQKYCWLLMVCCGVRISEACGIRWSDLDLDQGVWRIGADQYKTGRELSIPLSTQMVAMLESIPRVIGCDYVFVGLSRSGVTPISANSCRDLGLRLGCEYTRHGFRSTLRNWIAETTNTPFEVAEMTLGHVVGSSVTRSYMRSDLVEKRRLLMQQWSDFLYKVERSNVVPMARAMR